MISFENFFCASWIRFSPNNLCFSSRIQNSLLETDRYDQAVLLVRGANSDFVDDSDAEKMRCWFSHLREQIVPSAGHNVHVENRKGFLEVLDAYLQ